MIRELFLGDSLLWSCVWQSTIFLVVGLVVSFILRHRSARAHQVLFLAMMAAVIMPIMSILVKHYELGMFVAEPVVIQSRAEDWATTSDYRASGVILAEDIEHKPGPIEKDLLPAIAGSESAEFPWRSGVLYGWIMASLILAARLFVTFVLGVRLLGRALPLNCERIEEALHLARAKLGIDKDVKVRSSRSVRSPVIWCWRRNPVLLVPNDAGRFDNGIDWAGVLCHELAHWKRRDHISGLLAELVVCILPWHPLVWWAKSRLVRLSEQACDDWVVASGQPGTDYAESLLDLTPQGQMAFVPAVVRSRKGLAGRVRRILKDSCGNPRTGAIWALAVGIVAICITFGVSFAQTRPAKTEGTKGKSYFEGSFQLGKDINVELDAGPHGMRKIVHAKSVRFDKANSDIKVTLRADVRKGLCFEWRTRIELLGVGGKVLDQRYTLNKSGNLVSGQPVIEELNIEFLPFKHNEVANARRFRIRFEQAGPLLDELGRPYDANRTEWIEGRVTGPDGQPVVDAIVLINEHKPDGGPFRISRVGTDEKGYYMFGAVSWTYSLGAERRQHQTSTGIDCYQVLLLKRVFDGPQKIDFQFSEPPKGTASLVGHVVDIEGVPIREFTANISALANWKELEEVYSEESEDANGGYVKSTWFNQKVNSEDGVFRLENVPAGKYRIRIIPKEKQYEWHRQEVVLADGKTTNLALEVLSKHVLYGRVLFEDGSPAVIKPEPWPGAKTRILVPLGGRARGIATVEEDGYFAAYVDERELEQLNSTGSSLIINVPTTQQGRRKTVGRFPFELLSTEKSKAGVYKVSRPETKPLSVSDEASPEVDLRGTKEEKDGSSAKTDDGNDPESNVIVLRLVDSSGRPVAGAKVGGSARTRDVSVLGSKLSWSLRSREHNISNDLGKITLTREKLFSPSWPADRKLALYVLHEERHIGAVCEISRDGKQEEIRLTLEPVCRVHGSLDSEALKKIGRPLTWTNVYLNWDRDSFGVLSHMSDNQQFEFLVPPGQYQLMAYGSGGKGEKPPSTSAQAKHKRLTIKVEEGQSELDLGAIDLPPTKLATLIGKPAPELGPIQAWKNGSAVKLSELRGKAVIIYFDGDSPNTRRDLPRFVDLHKEFKDKGLA